MILWYEFEHDKSSKSNWNNINDEVKENQVNVLYSVKEKTDKTGKNWKA